MQVHRENTSCCAILPVPRAWPVASSVWILCLGYLVSVLAYYSWVLHLSLTSPIQLLRFKLRAGHKGLDTVCEHGDLVQLFVYDLSNGLARRLSPVLLNRQVSKDLF